MIVVVIWIGINMGFNYLKFNFLTLEYYIQNIYKMDSNNDIPIFQSKTGYNYTFLFAFEKKFFNETLAQEKMQFVSEYFYKSLVYAFIYLIILFTSQKFMEKREKFNLKYSLIAWNFVLAGFSTLGAIRVWPE